MALYAFDGTWCDEKTYGEYGHNTNVVKLKNYYRGNKHFYQGLGTRHGWFGKILGGAFGVGGKSRIKAALADVEANAANGDTVIDVIGFSRGAALSVHFANVLSDKGYKVRFLGLWDTVAAFGIPIDLFGINFQAINLGYRLTLPDNVQHCFHALALDENRSAFRPTRLKGACAEWFKGVHTDIGGQSGNTGLSNITLRRMAIEACNAGIDLDTDSISALETKPSAAISENTGVYSPITRVVLPGDGIHYTAVVHRESADG